MQTEPVRCPGMGHVTASRFWRFVRLRHQAWAAKCGLCPPPRDPVLARVRFTNVWRALDRGTLFAIHVILPQRSAADRVFDALMYRALNRIDSFKALVPPRTALDGGLLLHAASQWRARDGKVFTGVYCSSTTFHGAKWPGRGAPMDRRLAAYAVELAGNALAIASELCAAEGREYAFCVLRSATADTVLGPFAVNQAMTDLSYRASMGPAWPDDWCHLGPGAKAGLRLLGMEPTLAALTALRDGQPAIPWAPRYNQSRAGLDGTPARLSLADVEHALCEWQKYERASAGGHAKGIYAPLPPDAWRPLSPVPHWWRLPNA